MGFIDYSFIDSQFLWLYVQKASEKATMEEVVEKAVELGIIAVTEAAIASLAHSFVVSIVLPDLFGAHWAVTSFCVVNLTSEAVSVGECCTKRGKVQHGPKMKLPGPIERTCHRKDGSLITTALAAVDFWTVASHKWTLPRFRGFTQGGLELTTPLGMMTVGYYLHHTKWFMFGGVLASSSHDAQYVVQWAHDVAKGWDKAGRGGDGLMTDSDWLRAQYACIIHKEEHKVVLMLLWGQRRCCS